MSQTYEFQTEISQLLDLMIHSLYSEREIFLRELIANASDATDKRRFASLTDESLINADEELAITINYDEDANTITISDKGIGMNEAEVIENIGTIARSGTKKFIESIKSNKDSKQTPDLIGQFGVGFYSAFMVADKVELITRKAGEPEDSAVKWSSHGKGSYELESTKKSEAGTTITLFLREDSQEFASYYRLNNIVKKYSEHLSISIYLPKMDEEGKKSDEFEVVNDGTALWSKPKREITEEEYAKFYQSLHYDTQAPAITVHNKVEGTTEYTSLFFVPQKAPYDIYDRERKHGIKLYIRKMFILDDTQHILPTYLRFVRGVVDALDLPLNVSREFLQHNKEIGKIKSASTKKILNEFSKLAESDDEKDKTLFQALWDEYGRVLKEGIIEDFENKEALTKLFRFTSINNGSAKQNMSLQQYIDGLKENQESIYYITADSYKSALHSPHLEQFKKHNIDVLLLSDPVDEWVVTHLGEYEGKKLVSAAKATDLGDVINDEESKEKQEAQKATLSDLLEKIKTSLSDKVKDVRISSRLSESPVCLVADENDITGNMERMLKAMGQDTPETQPILEINPDHKIIVYLNDNPAEVDDWAELLFNQALLSEGGHLEDPALFVQKVNQLLSRQL